MLSAELGASDAGLPAKTSGLLLCLDIIEFQQVRLSGSLRRRLVALVIAAATGN